MFPNPRDDKESGYPDASTQVHKSARLTSRKQIKFELTNKRFSVVNITPEQQQIDKTIPG